MTRTLDFSRSVIAGIILVALAIIQWASHCFPIESKKKDENILSYSNLQFNKRLKIGKQ